MPKPRHRHAYPRSQIVDMGDQHIVSHGLAKSHWRDIYHSALTMRWPWFFVCAASLFVALNAVFAVIFQLGDKPIANQMPSGFLGSFFFSVETLATVGYGDMHPQTEYGHFVATVEIFIGMSLIALYTGLMFARFSLPHAKIIFAKYGVIRSIDGVPTLMLRIANARQNVIAEASAKLRMLRMETTPEGYKLRRVIDLDLRRDQHPIFALGWIVMHPMDESSPLFGATAESLAAVQATLLLSIEGVDETTSQTMRARSAWTSDMLRWNHRYVDLMYDDDEGVSHIDYNHFDEVVPLA